VVWLRWLKIGKPATSHWQTISHNVVSSTPCLKGFELTTLVVIDTDCIGSYKSNYHTITATTAKSKVCMKLNWIQNNMQQICQFYSQLQYILQISKANSKSAPKYPKRRMLCGHCPVF
jgi:hypothetical protein